MKLEQERGISVTSSVMQFEYEGYHINLLDTPGHEDFSEDTYRTLVAADSAVMLLDNRKGVEDRTRQLFAVCKRRRMPIFTFVNKCDRVGEDPLKLISDVEADLGIALPSDHLADPPRRRVRRRLRSPAQAGLPVRARRGSRRAARADVHVGVARRSGARASCSATRRTTRLVQDIALLDEAGHPFDEAAVLAGELSPVFFGSALTNFGVEPFLREFLELAPDAGAARVDDGHRRARPIRQFTGFVFKIQANMDAKHRDRVAFVRICSGRFEAGHAGEARAHGQDRCASRRRSSSWRANARAVEEAWPGDVIGVMDRGTLRIGDTLSTDERPRVQRHSALRAGALRAHHRSPIR